MRHTYPQVMGRTENHHTSPRMRAPYSLHGGQRERNEDETTCAQILFPNSPNKLFQIPKTGMKA